MTNLPSRDASAAMPDPGEREPDREPDRDCPRCPRLVDYRLTNRAAQPDWFNAPVPCFGDPQARLLVVGLAPGVRGANRTGRPFTGDHAGILLYQTLLSHGFASGQYDARPDDGLLLRDCRIANAVRCVPPQNLPTPAETRTCNDFLAAEIAALPALQVVLSLGTVAHGAVLRAVGMRQAQAKFTHGAHHAIGEGLLLADSYHVSRYNTATRRLTTAMFHDVVAKIRSLLG